MLMDCKTDGIRWLAMLWAAIWSAASWMRVAGNGVWRASGGPLSRAQRPSLVYSCFILHFACPDLVPRYSY